MASVLAASNVRPHDRFFFSDGSLYLLVENSLYCVHKFLFEIHATMFPVRELETSRNKPYVLGDVKKSDFDSFLAHLYPRTLGSEETETTQDWISILELASKWGFNTLQSKAISKIEQTLDSPVDMVYLGRQYGIPDVLLPGYAVLCQSTVPLSYEEGLRLGMEDVINIYRIRHELYGSGITSVPLEVAFAKVEEAGLGAERPNVQATDVGSVAASQTSAENGERGPVTLTPNIDSTLLEVASTGATTPMSETTEQQDTDAHSPSDELTSGALANRGSDVPSSVFPGNVSDLNSGPSVSAREAFRLIEELATNDLKLISSDIVQWINTTDIQTLHQITRLIVEKAIEECEHHNPCVRLSRAMVKYTQTLQRMTRLIVEKAIEEPHQFNACARLCNMIVKGTHDNVTGVGSSFCVYLGEVCQENMETVAASIAAAGELAARVRRRRLIEFIGALADLKVMDMWAQTIIDKWATALLDANDKEKVVTLCMVLTRADQFYTSCDMDSYVRRLRDIVVETSNHRVRMLLQYTTTPGGYIRLSVAQPSEDCTVQ